MIKSDWHLAWPYKRHKRAFDASLQLDTNISYSENICCAYKSCLLMLLCCLMVMLGMLAMHLSDI